MNRLFSWQISYFLIYFCEQFSLSIVVKIKYAIQNLDQDFNEVLKLQMVNRHHNVVVAVWAVAL